MDYFPLIIMLITIYLILAVADYYSTLLVIESGKGREANPLMAPLLKDPELALLVQLVSGAVFLLAGVIDPADAFLGLFVVDLLKALVVLNNVINGYVVWLKLPK